MTRATRTPLQRTPCQQGAAERDAPSPLDRPSRGLQSVQRGWPGHGKPRAGLPCRGLDRHCSGHRPQPTASRAVTTDFRKWRCAQPHEHRPRPASSRPRPGRRSGVNADALNITAPYANQASRCAGSAWWPGAARPAGSHKGRLCLAPRPSGQRRRLRPRRFNSQSARSRASTPTRVFSQALRARWSGAPARPAGSAAPGFSAARFSPRARSLRTRPPPRAGAPRRATATPDRGGKLPPFAQGA